MIAESGLILTTSSNLGSAPMAEYFTDSGVSGQAWVLGRDDDVDLALLEVIDPPGAFEFAEVEAQIPPARLAELALLQFPGGGTVIDKRSTRVVGSGQDFNTGLSYIQLQAIELDGAEGAALVDRSGVLHGMRMDSAHLANLGFARPGEVYAITSESLRNVVLPRLEAGVRIVNKADPTDGSSGSVPSRPATFRGSITIGGELAPVGSVLYVRVSRTGRPDVWVDWQVVIPGRFFVPVTVTGTGYAGADVDFFFRAKQADQGARFEVGSSSQLDLTFQP